MCPNIVPWFKAGLRLIQRRNIKTALVKLCFGQTKLCGLFYVRGLAFGKYWKRWEIDTQAEASANSTNCHTIMFVREEQLR